MFGVFFTKLALFSAAITPGVTTCQLPSSKFFFLPSWWEYLPGRYDELYKCSPYIDSSNVPAAILPIGLAALDIMIRLSGIIATISIIIAGVQYIISSGNPENAAKARKRIYNSMIGLGLVFISAGIVAFIGNSLK